MGCKVSKINTNFDQKNGRNFESILRQFWLLSWFWVNFESILSPFWVHFEPILSRFWVNFEPFLSQFWVDFELILSWFWVMFWVDFEPSLSQVWVNFEPENGQNWSWKLHSFLCWNQLRHFGTFLRLVFTLSERQNNILPYKWPFGRVKKKKNSFIFLRSSNKER